MAITEESRRRKAVNAALALVRHQDLEPTDAIRQAAERFVAGEISQDEFVTFALGA